MVPVILRPQACIMAIGKIKKIAKYEEIKQKDGKSLKGFPGDDSENNFRFVPSDVVTITSANNR